MTIDSARFQQLLGEFKLDQLFNELGWDHASLKPQEVPVGDEIFTLAAIAQKRGVAVFRCSPDTNGNIPPRPTLLKIEKEAVKLAHEHLLIFTDAAQSTLTWLWVSRAPGQPSATRTHTWHQGTSGESLRQKLNQIVWALEEEEAITLTDVITGLRRAFDRDRVTKKFYEHFKAEHQAFADFIKGIAAATDQAWYASLMLNRLMFVYFIQQKGFLDSNQDYLADRMQRVREQSGKGHFHSFYRLFLRRLFHEGLGQDKSTRKADLSALIGEVPYLNGGLFAVHELEEAHPDIDIPDEAFERLFKFFNAYDWHLDDRPLVSGSEINPDVLGYIFEKYINQKQMGAYYTKEDITEYISKNTVVPHLLEQARDRCKVAFEGDNSVWALLKNDPGRYIYPAMKTGVVDASGNLVPETALPDFVQTGMHDPKARMFERRYNLGEALFHNATGERGTLPTETWREYVERRTRCLSVREKLARGEVKSADDLVTLNLDIRQFMQDVIDTCTGPDLLRAVWQAIVGRVPGKNESHHHIRHGITILDPTCGSGAFLFSALNVLELLYEACLDRMEGFVEDAKKLGKPIEADFGKVLDEVGRHPSRRYFIYKNIILHNLFGVDIMAEAVEICKLRLFLKLVSQVDGGGDLEPLPDIDFNIRCGNTLVGYATEAEFAPPLETISSDYQHRDEIKASTADLADLFDRFREQQTVHGGKVTSDDKRKLRDKLNGLSLELDRYLAHDYGIDPDKPRIFKSWRESHQPFHWFAEFYGVMREGGFDVVIGNPPWVEFAKVSGSYKPQGLQTISCNNLWAFVVERSYQVLNPKGLLGLIVPMSLVCTERMKAIQDIASNVGKSWISNYESDSNPGQLFDGVKQNVSILVTRPSSHKEMQTTRLVRFFQPFRSYVFETLHFCSPGKFERIQFGIPKIGSADERQLLAKLFLRPPLRNEMVRHSKNSLLVHRIAHYYIKCFDFVPYFRSDRDGEKKSEDYKHYAFRESTGRYIAAINSTAFYFYWQVFFDGFKAGKACVENFPFGGVDSTPPCYARLEQKSISLMADMQKNATRLQARYATSGNVEYDQFSPRKSKELIDDIDQILAHHYGLTDAELDLVINYDVKFRSSESDEEE